MYLLMYLHHWFVNAIITFVMLLVLYFIVAPFFIWKFICAIVKCFHREDNMAGKVVLITGASSGIGEHMAYEYARKKASLVIVARRESRLREVAEKARSFGSPDVVFVCADVSNVDDCKKFIDKAIEHFGRLDHLVNNAGIACVCPIEDAIDIKKFTAVMDVNFWGSIYPTYFAIPHLKKTKGSIVVNSSSAALLHPPRGSFYSASKAALIGFYESLRTELVPSSITITIVTLGFIESEMSQGKYISKEGTVGLHKSAREEISVFAPPVMSTEPCAKAIVEGSCRGDRYVAEPQSIRVFFLIKLLCPEFIGWYFRTFLLKKP